MTDDQPRTPSQGDADAQVDVRVFERHRGLLFSIAYRMLGSATEAEDVVQDAWLRFASTPPPTGLRSPRAWLGTIVTRLCLDRLKAARTTREQYTGPWLPEPVVHADREPSLARAVEQRESITLAFLVLLESLTPQERAVFLLREVFDYEYGEIGAMLDLSPANCRQLFHRAKQRIAEHRPRFQAPPARHKQLVEAFLQAIQHGNVEEVRSLLTEEVVCTADGGGKVASINRPLQGATPVARLMVGLAKLRDAHARPDASPPMPWSMTTATVNGETAILFWVAGDLDSVLTVVATDDGIRQVDIVRNPDKLAHVKAAIDAPRG